jgi:hypothetical protein
VSSAFPPLARHRGQKVEVLFADEEPADGARAGVEVLVTAPHREVDAVAKPVRTLG